MRGYGINSDGVDILVEFMRQPGRSKYRLRLTYEFDELNVRVQKGGNTRNRFFELFQQLHKAALGFVAKLIYSPDFGKEGAYGCKVVAHAVQRGTPVYQALPENGSDVFIDAEIVEE